MTKHPTVAVVTGGASGIGRAICSHFADAGAIVAILDRDKAGLARTRKAFLRRGLGVEAYHVDVSEPLAVSEAFRAIHTQFNQVDVLINNAGLSLGGGVSTHELPDEAWLQTVGTMQTGVFLCSREAARLMIPRRSGVIINIASIRGISPRPGRLAYCATKAAVIMMTKVMASEWGQYNIRVNAVAPGVTKTPYWGRLVRSGQVDEAEFIDVTPLNRIARPDEIAKLCGYLVTADASFISGACITIDGGLTTIPSA